MSSQHSDHGQEAALLPEHRRKLCPSAGGAWSHRHGEHGDHHEEGILFYPPYAPDAYCYKCGKPYPWTEKAINSTAACIYEDETLSQELAEKLVESLPDITAETPATNLAVLRYGKVLRSVGKLTADSIRQFVIEFGCELAKQSLLP